MSIKLFSLNMLFNTGRMDHTFVQFSLSYLKEGKVLILVDLNCKNRVARCLSETTQTHLGIKEVHHRLLQIKKKSELR